MSRPRVFLADDHEMLLEAFTKLLEDHSEVVGTARDGEQVLERVVEARPDVVVLDITMPRLNGLDTAARLRERLPDARVIFLTMNADPDVAAKALAEGAKGYLLKNGAASELRTAIDAAMQGRTYITPLIAADVLAASQAPASDFARLTPRQREVLQLLAEGLTMKEIAARLDLTARTVAHHKYTLMESLGLESNADLVRFAVRNGLIES